MNQVVLIGRLTKDPELSYTQNTQTAVCRFTLAIDRPPKANGEDTGADFIRITVWGRPAESCDRFLSKGSQVAILGRIQTGSYKNQQGATVYTTDVVAERVKFLGASRNNNEETPSRGNEEPEPLGDLPDTFQSAYDDVPF